MTDVSAANGGTNASGTEARPSDTNSYSLLVKNPTDRPGASPFIITIDTDATALQLKQLLHESYPGSPPVPEQRLIYAGKLLDDRDELEAIFGAGATSAQHTVHLVVATRNAFRPASSASTAAAQSTSGAGNAAGNIGQQGQHGAPQFVPGNLLPNYFQYPTNPYLYPTVQPPMPPNAPQAYQMPFTAPFPIPPPPSDNPEAQGTAPNGAVQTPFGMPPSAYAAHLQSMERMIAESLAAQQNAAREAASAAAAGAADGVRDGEAQMRAGQQAAAQAAAAVAAMHAQAHAQAMANYNAGVGGQLEINAQAQQQGGQAQAHPVGFGFAIGRGNMGPNGVQQHHHQHPNQEMGDGAPRVRQFVLQFEINWALISKLIFVVYLLGQEGTPTRVYSLMIVAGIIYLWQTNRLGFLRRVARAAVPNPAQLVETLFPQTDGNDAPNDASSSEARSRSRQPNRFGRAAVILSFVYSFVYGFVCSLLPAWQPEPLPRMDELLHRNQEEENTTPTARNQDGDNHEHAD